MLAGVWSSRPLLDKKMKEALAVALGISKRMLADTASVNSTVVYKRKIVLQKNRATVHWSLVLYM